MAQGQRTYLQMTNRVLIRLGKQQVASADFAGLAADSWGGIVKTMLNDAQAAVWKEHDWSTLRTTGTFTTSSRTYDLSTSFSNFGREIDLVSTTNTRVLVPVNPRDLDEWDPVLTTAGAPTGYAISYPNLLFSLTPSSEAFRIRYLIRPTDLSAAGDTSTLPEYCDEALVWYCVWQLYATREDAEDGGQQAFQFYKLALTRAVQQDQRTTDLVYRLHSAFPSRVREIVPFPPQYDRNP